VQDFPLEKALGNFLVFCDGSTESLGQDMAPDVKERLQGASKIRFRGCNIMFVEEKFLFVLDGEILESLDHLFHPSRPLSYDIPIDLAWCHFTFQG
jgi:hypothetical protein